MPAKKTTTRKRRATALPPALAKLRTEIYASLGDTSFKVEAELGVAAEVAAALHQQLEALGKLRPTVLPTVDGHGGSLYVDDGDDAWARRHLGFDAARSGPR